MKGIDRLTVFALCDMVPSNNEILMEKANDKSLVFILQN
jgi:hypothetical protein